MAGIFDVILIIYFAAVDGVGRAFRLLDHDPS